MTIFHRLLNLLQMLYVIRFSVLPLIFLVVFPFMIFYFGTGRTLLEGLYDLEGFCEAFWISFFAYMLSWTAVTLTKITMTLGKERFFRGRKLNFSFINRKSFHITMFVIGAICPVLFFTGIFFDRNVWWKLGGLTCGAAASLLMLFVVDLIQLLARNLQAEGRNALLRSMIIPFPYPLARRALNCNLLPAKWEAAVNKWLSEKLQRVPKDFRRGYICDENGQARIEPAQVFAVLMFLVFLLIYAVGFLIWYNTYAPDPLGNDVLREGNFGVTSLSYLLMLLTLVCSFLSGVAFFLDRYRVPTLVVIAGLISLAPLRHTYVAVDRQDIKEFKPQDALGARKDSPYILLVAANGGGIQATAWTMKVLSKLVQECKQLDTSPDGCEKSIALISSVSGGSVGTMFFLNSYGADGKIDEKKLPAVEELSQGSSLDYVAGGLVYADFIRNIPGVYAIGLEDRGGALEKSWRDNAKDKFGGTDPQMVAGLNKGLADWREDAINKRRPAVIFNSTMVETGERVTLATTDITPPDPLDANDCSSGYPKLFEGWKNFHTMFNQKDISVTTAARLSASFPVVSPAANMRGYDGVPDDQRLPFSGMHLVDGGYNENYGIASLLDWLDQGLCKNPGYKPRIMIIQIVGDKVFEEGKNYTSGVPVVVPSPSPSPQAAPAETPAQAGPGPAAGFLRKKDKAAAENNIDDKWFGQILAPVTTILGVRGTIQLGSNESELELFLRYWRRPKFDSTTKTLISGINVEKAVFEYAPFDKCRGAIGCRSDVRKPPLSWHLTEVQKNDISDAWTRATVPCDRNYEALEAFRTFIKPDRERQTCRP